MKALVDLFWQILLLRRGPQDVPDAPVLTGLLAALYVLVSLPLGLTSFGGWGRSLGAVLLELALSAALLFAALQVRGHAARWRQTYAAILGTGTLIGVLALGYRLLGTLLGLTPLADLLDLAFLVWSLVVLGHILRHALEIPMALAIVLALAYTMFLVGLLAQWLLPEAVPPAPAFE